MQMQEVKAVTKQLGNITAEFERHSTSNSVQRVEFKDQSGKILMVVVYESYAIKIVEPAPPKMKKVFELKANAFGQEIKIQKNYEHELDDDKSKLELAGFVVSVSEIEVEDV